MILPGTLPFRYLGNSPASEGLTGARCAVFGVPQASVAAVSRFANRATFSSRVRLRTHFVVGVGTGETLTGAGRRLKEHDPRIKIVSIVPEIFPGIEGLKPVGRRSR